MSTREHDEEDGGEGLTNRKPKPQPCCAMLRDSGFKHSTQRFVPLCRFEGYYSDQQVAFTDPLVRTVQKKNDDYDDD